MKTPILDNVRKSDEDIQVSNLNESEDRKKEMVRRMAKLSTSGNLLNKVLGMASTPVEEKEREKEKPIEKEKVIYSNETLPIQAIIKTQRLGTKLLKALTTERLIRKMTNQITYPEKKECTL